MKNNELVPLMKRKRALREKERHNNRLPSWYHGKNDKEISVIFIQNMDEFIAGEEKSVPVGLYRNWLYPHKIALAATQANIAKYSHLNSDLRQRIHNMKEMKQLSDDITKYRMEMRLKKDPNTNEIYTKITKEKIARRLLIYKSILIKDYMSNIRIMDNKNVLEANELEYIDNEGSYTIKILLGNDNSDSGSDNNNSDLKFEFRLNARSIFVSKETKNKPFDWQRIINNEQGDEIIQKMPVEMRKQLNKYNRSKTSHFILDDIYKRKDGTRSRYHHLYESDVVKTKLG